MDVVLISQNAQVTHCRVDAIDNTWSCFVSFVYGENCHVRREDLWLDIGCHATIVEGSPWLVAGDFNAIRNQNESIGGSTVWPSWMDEFNVCIDNAELDDLRYGGAFYTWSNRREDSPILRKLDRALTNIEWGNTFPGSEALFLPAGVSDHSPMIIKLADMPRFKKPFRFYHFWVDHPHFLTLVDEVWRGEASGTPMYQLCTRLKRLKKELKKLNKDQFSDLSNRVLRAKERMENLQKLVQQNPLDGNLCKEEASAVKEYGDLSRAEESFFKQKSRVQWLNLGD